MSTKQFLDYSGLQEVAGNVNTRLKTVSIMPASASEGAIRLYVGETDANYIKGHIYQNVVTPFFAWKSPDSEQYVYTLSEQPVAGDFAYGSPSTTATSEEVISYDSALDSIELSDAYWARNTSHDTVTSAWVDITSTGGTSDYSNLSNLPSINGKVLVANEDGHTYSLVNVKDLGGLTEDCEQNTSFSSYSANAFINFNGKLYIGTSDHGIYVSDDGVTFTRNTSFPYNYTVHAFGEYNGKLYVCPNSGIYVSDDGTTFTKNTSFPTGYRVLELTEFNGKLYIGTSDYGIYVSDDGETFTQNTSFPTYSYFVLAFTEFNGKLYVGTDSREDEMGIYVSDDGVTFTRNTSFPIDEPATAFLKYNGKLYVGTYYSGIYVSDDGTTFTQNTSFPTGYRVLELTEFNGKLYVSTYEHGVYVSDDGTTFTQTELLPTSYYVKAFINYKEKLFIGTLDYGIYTLALILRPTSTPYVQALDTRYQKGQIGDLSSLNTTSKTTIVSAVNEVNNKVDALPSPVTPKGTIPFASLPSLASVEVGWMYNISDDFTTTSDFVISGISEKAGSNVYCIDTGSGVKKWDVFAVSGGGSVVVDQTYDPTSTNPQSGTAVAQAIGSVVVPYTAVAYDDFDPSSLTPGVLYLVY